tara:strand:+ start:40 stop:594 length:555 start_codon:yes stop_codon:yes gene_type:complete
MLFPWKLLQHRLSGPTDRCPTYLHHHDYRHPLLFRYPLRVTLPIPLRPNSDFFGLPQILLALLPNLPLHLALPLLLAVSLPVLLLFAYPSALFSALIPTHPLGGDSQLQMLLRVRLLPLLFGFALPVPAPGPDRDQADSLLRQLVLLLSGLLLLTGLLLALPVRHKPAAVLLFDPLPSSPAVGQ